MSLDVYLQFQVPGQRTCPECGSLVDKDPDVVFTANITHNLGEMAVEAGVYWCLWRPEEIGISKAGQLIDHLRCGLAALREAPDRFRTFNPKNGWGTYEGLVRFVEGYLAACEEHPEAGIYVSR
jgi:hypothetical protein